MPASIARYVRQNVCMKVDLVPVNNRLDLETERIDIALRLGALAESAMMQRAFPPVPLFLFAAPDNLARRGVPAAPEGLAEHYRLDFFTAGPSVWRRRTARSRCR